MSLISNAFADASTASAAGGENSTISLVVMLVAFGLIFYFMILRPQQKRSKEHKKLMDAITKGEEVMTNGGLIGRVVKVSANGFLTIELNTNIKVVIKRDFIAAVLPKGTIESESL